MVKNMKINLSRSRHPGPSHVGFSKGFAMTIIASVLLIGAATATAQSTDNLFTPGQPPRQPPQLPIPDQSPRDPFQEERPRQSNQPGAGFDQQDPTQAEPDMRRILEGEQEQVRRDPPPSIEVVGKVIGARGVGKALLRINGQYRLVEKGSRFSSSSQTPPTIYTVTNVDIKGVDVEVQNGEQTHTQRLP